MGIIRTNIAKTIAVIMSVLYIITPLQHEIANVLHSISHHLKKPTNIISHNLELNLENRFKENKVQYHEHKLVDLMNELLSADMGAENSELPNLKDVKIDKHFSISKYHVLWSVENEEDSSHFDYREYIPICFSKKTKIPPRIV